MKCIQFFVFILSIASIRLHAVSDLDASFDRIAKIQEEMKFWQDQLKNLEKQKEKGKVSKAYLMTLNAILLEMQTLRKEAVLLLDEINKEEQRIKKEKEQAEKSAT